MKYNLVFACGPCVKRDGLFRIWVHCDAELSHCNDFRPTTVISTHGSLPSAMEAQSCACAGIHQRREGQGEKELFCIFRAHNKTGILGKAV